MKRLPIGIQTFSDIIEQDYLYVDKTRDIYKLLSTGGKFYFLSRPRRFGKSLLVSTLKELFSGNKELFKNLWIYDKIQWQTYPIIHLDFTAMDYDDDTLLKKSIDETIKHIGAGYDIKLSSISYKTRFSELIAKLSAKSNLGKVIILIDEYDKPIIDLIENADMAKKNRKILKEFYNILKSSEDQIKFAFMTGVSKFSRVSVFSGLNNLDDITIDYNHASILGYTQEELNFYFKDRLDQLHKEGRDRESLAVNIKNWYNGYSWDGESFVYNPFSILNFFKKKQFGNYWFASGTPTFLLKLITEKGKNIREYEEIQVGDWVFESYDIENLETIALLFQTGYLTIKCKKTIIVADGDEVEYTLTYPNKEVKDSFIRYLFRTYTGKEFAESEGLLRQLTTAIKGHHFEEFFEIIGSLFASISYNIFIKDKEAYYHSIMYMIFRLMGLSIQTEVQTATGRIDAVIETDSQLIIVEFKMGTAKEALRQIKEKKYFEGYLSASKTLIIMGIGFNVEKRNLNDYLIEQIKA